MANCLFCGEWTGCGCNVGGGSSSGSSGSSTYILPTASRTLKGGIKVGEGLEMQGETLNATGGSVETDYISESEFISYVFGEA